MAADFLFVEFSTNKKTKYIGQVHLMKVTDDDGG